MNEPTSDETRGAINHSFLLSLSKISPSNSWATKKAVPHPIAILIEIKSSKFVEKKKVKNIPRKKPI